ncbi:hypothetical protein [Dactylosporangium sp. NPDC049140]|uniref:hypothetical protein n=1 Tax=Dactylosporangium sp. NPDC049140 TaxID=3155647 RepID=UPI0033D1BA71
MDKVRPTELSLVLLVLLPPAAAAAFLRALWLAHGSGLLYLYTAVGVVAGALLAPYLRTRPMFVLRLPFWLIVLCAASFGLPIDGGGTTIPAAVALPVSAAVAGLTAVAAVVAVLWTSGLYTIELRHRASVALTSAGEDDFYQARCDCGWRGPILPMTRDDDAEEQAFADAAAHAPDVRRDIDVVA